MNTVLVKTEGRAVIFQWTSVIDQLVRIVLEEAARLSNANISVLYRYNRDGKLVGSALPGNIHSPSQPDEHDTVLVDSESSNTRRPDRHRLARHALKSRMSALYRKGADVDGLPLEKSAATILLTIPEGDVGVIVLQKNDATDVFYDNEYYLVRSLAASFALVLRGALFSNNGVYLRIENTLTMLLENTYLNQHVRESDGRLRAVLEVSNVINSSRQLDEMIEAVLYSAVHVIRAESASLFLIDEATGELVFDVITGNQTLKGIRIPQGEGIVGLCAREKRPIIVNDAVNDERIYRSVDEVSRMTTRNLLASPLLIEDECIGVIEVVNTVGRADFSPGDLEMFTSFSDSVAIALQRRRLIDNIETTNRELERRLRENKCLHRVTAAMVEAQSIDALFNDVLRVLTDELEVRKASIMLIDEKTGDISIHASIGLPNFDEDAIEPRLARYVIEKGIPLYVSDIRDHPELHVYADLDRYHSGACILIPMSEGIDDSPVGLLSVSDPTHGTFHPDDFRIVVTATSQIVKGYTGFKLAAELLDKKAMEKELEITSRLQRDILPSQMPKNDYLEMAARAIMAKTMGGDFYDFYQEDGSGKLTALVADVSGKSLPAALFMAVSSSILRTMIRTETDPALMLRRANDLLYEESESGMFVTVFVSRFDPEAKMLHYASAGHNEMILMHRDGSYEVLRSRGAPIGVIPSSESHYESKQTQVKEGDLLVLYTDGVVEAVNRDNEEFGLDRFVAVLQDLRNLPLDDIIQQLYQHIQHYAQGMSQYDDFTLLLSRYQTPVDEMRLVYPAKQQSVPHFVDDVARYLKKHSIEGNVYDDILLAADEVSTNIVSYSFVNLPVAEPKFQCVLKVAADQVSMMFIDGGNEYDFDSVKQPDLNENLSGERMGGFGVFLIRALMDRTDYSRRNGMNYLILEKKIS